MSPAIQASGEATAPEVFQQLGAITRQLHDALEHLGVMPQLQQSARGLSDARSRLGFIARKTGEAADKVLNAVDLAKLDRQQIDLAVSRVLELDDQAPVADARDLVTGMAAAAARIDDHLTDIMLAQDFHDLTGQVVSKVVALAIDLEASLVKLLVQAAPAEVACAPASAGLEGPVVDAVGRQDVVVDQGEVDDLLASLGF